MSHEETTPIHRQKTAELPALALLSHRIYQVEKRMEQASEQNEEILDGQREILTRLAVGTERFSNADKRLDSLEGDRRWVVLAVLGSIASLAWNAVQILVRNTPPHLLLLVALPLVGCIPVTIVPERDTAGLPIPLPVTPIGQLETPAGAMAITPVYPTSREAPAPPSSAWPTIISIAGLFLGVGGGGIALRSVSIASKARTALGIACTLADRLAEAPDEVAVKEAKARALAQQLSAGVHVLTQEVRKESSNG